IVTYEQVDTIADGVAARLPVPEAVADMDGTVDETMLVQDTTILAAMRLIHEHLGLVIEPAGAIGVAAILADPARFHGRLVATVLCGANLTPRQIADWLTPTGDGSRR
ncbi:MAG: pyridoxal-phosphate dependent enzyme, partial [Gemmatimonadaceae bacterium]